MPLSAELANITWMLLTAALVMLMQGGFCCLESGLSRAKNSINVAIKNLSDFCVSSLLFWMCGFGMMFGADKWGLIGTDSFQLTGTESPWLLAFFLFQLVFCGTSTTIVSGAVAERMKFSTYLIVSALISGIIYPVFGHWAWGGLVPGSGKGWLAERGFIDFAGSSVVHSVGGWVALTSIIMIGPRLGRFEHGFKKIHGHNYPMAVLGTMLLWFGWFGFNGGSTLVIDGSIPLILVNTNLAAGAGGLAALLFSWPIKKRADVGDIMNGVIAGLVGITASCHIMTPATAILIGVISAAVFLLGTELLERLKIDDVIGAVPVHAMCGVWGTLAVALLANSERFGSGNSNWEQFQVQLLGVSVCCLWCCSATVALLSIVSITVGLRVSPEAERQGLNISEHGASTELTDLLQDMRHQSVHADFSLPVAVEPHTEVGQIASEYNKVLHKVVGEIEQREGLVSQLKMAEEKFRSMFENATEGIFRFAPNGRFLDANPAMAQILGYPDPTTLISEVADIRRQLYVDVHARYRMMEVLSAHGKIINFETSLYRRDGSTIDVSLNARLVTGMTGSYEYIEGSVTDMTQRRQAELFRREKEAAESASRAKSSFLATMSHEIRTPLNGVIGMLELLSNSDLSDKQNRYTTIAKSSAQSLLSLINDILDFSKIEAGKFELHQSEFDLLGLLEEVTDMFGHRSEQKGLELSCMILPEVPARVIGDPERIRQILVNLLGNALKFTEHGEVRLRAKVIGQNGGKQVVRIEVEDTGVGIPTDVQARLFQVFEQADSSTTRKYGGTGLGLAICRQLIELMNGTIGVSSKMGEGSLFWCELPFEVVPSISARRVGDVKIQGLRILAVDDNHVNLQILETQLTAWQAHVTTALNAKQAMALLEAHAGTPAAFDLVILDFQMPETDGLALAKNIHAETVLSGIPLIMLTSSDAPATSQDLKDLGIRACCNKPILQSRLFDVLMTTLHGSEYITTARQKRIEQDATQPEPVQGQARRVLIADDNEINQMVTQEIVERVGYRCRIANNGAEAIELLKKRHFDIVLMDCQMPVMDGFTATKEIRRMQTGKELPTTLPPRIPIIALTANAVMGDRERCLAAGMTDYVTKPVDPQRLLDVIAKHLPAACERIEEDEPVVETIIEQPAKATVPVAAESETPEVPPLDWKALQDRCAGDSAFARRIIEKFRTRVQDDLARIGTACERGDLEESRRLAHSLKGSASSVAAMKVAETAAAIEVAAKAAHAEELSTQFFQLKDRINECLDFIEQHTAKI
ncbi:ammonium transporter [Planctomicrobium piriforme]|uniref:Sensory/regulatory protein RpfC n=1 Tax=Planctomicrobium piriforme TaxID=1576369 RepID=A0A1I3NAU1_9PLAN|nr:ammonium transporter [Planctomicrobium piriforme]SFJ06332.1 ammonium transporter, Amt family [Planctomicrobium piriforme]